MVLLALHLKVAFPTALWSWYTDNAAAGESFEDITRVFILLLITGKARGCLPELAESILAVKSAMVGITRLSSVACSFPQATLCAFQQSYQYE